MNIFRYDKVCGASEVATVMYEDSRVLIERIVSRGYANDEGFYYNQSHDEWVSVAEGWAVLSYADGRQVTLNKGDTLTIPAGIKHRVDGTSSMPACIWICVHIKRGKDD